MIALAISSAITLLLIAIMLAAMLAPVEAMSWWAGWADREAENETVNGEDDAELSKRPFIVYLAGVNVISGDALTGGEKRFLNRLSKIEPGCVIVDDIFPYSPDGRPLIGNTRAFMRVWKFLARMKLGSARQLGQLINFRNIFQVLVAADQRYGPIFNFGAADIIHDGLMRAGYVKGSKAPIFVIGYSGGGQIAAGTVGYLKRLLRAPIFIISVGGVLASPPDLIRAAGIHHLRSDRDKVEQLGAAMFPQRWPMFERSAWNRAKRAGRLHIYDLKDMAHTGQSSYFGRERSADGPTKFQQTLDCVTTIITSELEKLAPDDEPEAPPRKWDWLKLNFALR